MSTSTTDTVWACLISGGVDGFITVVRCHWRTHPSAVEAVVTLPGGLIEYIDPVYRRPEVIQPAAAGMSVFVADSRDRALAKAVLWYEALSAEGDPGAAEMHRKLKTMRDEFHVEHPD